MAYVCATCGEVHDELPMAFGADAPDSWVDATSAERDGDSELTPEQCILGERYFLRGCLDVPVGETGEVFRWLVWVELSEDDFWRTSDAWEREGRELEPAMPGRLDSTLPYELPTRGIEVMVHTQPVGERPQVRASPGHPLYEEQRVGITAEIARSRAEALIHGIGPVT
ncbi:MAG: DUF2199 domain-containing protein [Gemmatimonadetes bacterium]|nr:DUF2199 domain-containing protein [Gemmatimonadota bacterium]